MLEGSPELTLALLNTATQAWSKRSISAKSTRRSTRSPRGGCAPQPSVARAPTPMRSDALSGPRSRASSAKATAPSPSRGALRSPSAYRTLLQLRAPCRSLGLASIDLVDPRSASTSRPCCHSTRRETPSAFGASSRRHRPASHRARRHRAPSAQAHGDYAATGLPLLTPQTRHRRNEDS